MADILLLHSALGLRPAVLEYADLLRDAGHTVHTPDYYDGHVFDGNDGLAYRDEVGGRALFGRLSLDNLPEDAVLAGFSLGAAFAQRLAADRPAARAVVLLHSLGAPRGPWPGQPVQVHRHTEDPFISQADVLALKSAVLASGAAFEDVVVPGKGHLFTDLDDVDGDRHLRDDSVARMLALLCS